MPRRKSVNLRREILKQGYKNVCPHCHTWQVNRRDLLLNTSLNKGQETMDLRNILNGGKNPLNSTVTNTYNN